MKLRCALGVAVVVSLGLVPPPAAATHSCNIEEPYCGDRRTLVQKPERQEVISRVMGHHCYGDADAGDPNRDQRVLLSRIGVVFTNVTRHTGYLETVTVYFEGRERQIMGSVEGFGREKQDFHRYDDRQYNPGSKTTLLIDRQVEFNDYEGRKDVGVYNIRHEAAASRPGASGPGGDPGGPAPPSLGVDCHGVHYLILEVTPPSSPPCTNKPPRPCPPQ
ncbi:MAG: hypothetical protein M3357_07375 [Actinomycetota bacterium]|nr:hypothetical protein [Actinomycetota bacterium]